MRSPASSATRSTRSSARLFARTRSAGPHHPALRRRPARLLPAARGHQRHRLGPDRLRQPRRLRGLSRTAEGRSRGPANFAVRAERALHPARGAHLPRDRGPAFPAGSRSHDRRHLRSRAAAPGGREAYLDAAAACGRCSRPSMASSRSSASRASPTRARSCRCRSGATRRRCAPGATSRSIARPRRRARGRCSPTTACASRDVLRDYGLDRPGPGTAGERAVAFRGSRSPTTPPTTPPGSPR